jgi:hypothetical protein
MGGQELGKQPLATEDTDETEVKRAAHLVHCRKLLRSQYPYQRFQYLHNELKFQQPVVC